MDRSAATKVRVAVFHGAGQGLEIKQVAAPAVGNGEMLVRVICCTLCGSDLHTYQGHRAVEVPTVLGHEILGQIVTIGHGMGDRDRADRPLRVGDRVTWSVAASCGSCFYCGHDLEQKCEHLFKYGHEKTTSTRVLSGGLAEYCHLAAGTPVLRVPEGLPDDVACPANCATATVAAALRRAGGCRNELVLIQGAGMLGLTACAMARRQGANRVIVCDVDESRVAAAQPFGADVCVSVKDHDQDLADAVAEASDGRGVDVALELSGSSKAMDTGLKLLRIGGRYVWVGAVWPGPAISVEPESVVRRLLTITGVHNYGTDDLAEAIAFLGDNHRRYPFGQLVTQTFSLDNCQAAFEYAITSGAPRVAVRPWQ